MISTPDRKRAVQLIDEAVAAGARKFKACEELGIAVRTYQRWTEEGEVKADGRPGAQRPEPGNKLTQAERDNILEVANSQAFKSLPPSQIVPALADKGRYIASESSFYRVLREHGQQQHRGGAMPRAQAVKYPLCHGAEPDLVLGHNLAAGTGKGLLLPVSDSGSVQPQDRRVGDLRRRVERIGVAVDTEGLSA